MVDNGYEEGRSIDPLAQYQTLTEVLTNARNIGERGIVVFDLDSTLLDNRPRQARILREFGAALKLPELAKTTTQHWTSWEIADAMRATGLSAQLVARHVDSAKQFWRDRFFTSAYCRSDIPMAGATNFLTQLARTGVQIAYVTGRHTEMGEGTIDSFRAANFPLPDEKIVRLLLKPTFDLADDAWKEMAYADLAKHGEVLAAFDNEPSHINGYHDRFPNALCVHLVTDHSGRPISVAPGIRKIANFVR